MAKKLMFYSLGVCDNKEDIILKFVKDLQKNYKKILLIDLDPQSNLSKHAVRPLH